MYMLEIYGDSEPNQTNRPVSDSYNMATMIVIIFKQNLKDAQFSIFRLIQFSKQPTKPN